MKLYRPNKAEWITFWALVLFLIASANYLFYGAEGFLAKRTLLVSYPLLFVLMMVSWYLHVAAQNYVRNRMKEVDKSFKRFAVLEVVHFVMTSASFIFFFWLYDYFSILGYQFDITDYWLSLVIAFTLSIIATAIWEGYWMFLNYRRTMAERDKLQRITFQEELNALKSQVNPHFLFNSLNSLSSLIGDDPKKAEMFLDEMSKVYRYLLRNNDVELTNVSTELKFIRSYFHLLSTRYGDGIVQNIRVKSTYDEYLIPPLTLQLLVENAVKHNVIMKEKPLTITIETDDEGQLIVKNNLQRKTVSVASNKIGLKNIHERYKLLGTGTVTVNDDGQYFSVALPLLRPQDQPVRLSEQPYHAQ